MACRRRMAFAAAPRAAAAALRRRYGSFTSPLGTRPQRGPKRLKNQKETTQRHHSWRRVAPTASRRRGTAARRDTARLLWLARMTRWVLTGNDVSMFLGIERLVHPVKFDGMVLAFAGIPVNVYAWAAFESLEIKYENASKVLTLKSRTFLAGSGRPEAQPRLLAYSRGEAGGLIGRDLEEAQIQEMMAARPGY